MTLATRRKILDNLRLKIHEAIRDRRTNAWLNELIKEYYDHCKKLTKELEAQQCDR